MEREYNRIFAGETTPKEAMETIKKEADELLVPLRQDGRLIFLLMH